MATFTVIVAPPGPLTGVLEVLRDLSGDGLTEDFAWATVDPRAPNLGLVAQVHRGEVGVRSLTHLLGNDQFDLVRVCVLRSTIAGAAAIEVATAARIADQTASASGRRILRLACVVGRAQESGVEPVVPWEGWHNVVVADEDGPGPLQGLERLGPACGPADLARHAISVVAAICGLWSPGLGGVLDDREPDSGSTFRLIRSWYRRLDTTELEQSLRAKVGSTDPLPLAQYNGAPAVPIDDVALACRQMAAAVWARNQGYFRGPREQNQPDTAREIGATQLIKMFFGFLGAALRNAPAAWVRTVVDRASSKAARAVQNAIAAGDQVSYVVVVRGRTPDGSPAGMLARSRAVANLEPTMIAQSGGHRVRTDLRRMWSDFANGALTLADAGSRSAELPPIDVGGRQGVVRDPDAIVPGQGSEFRGLPPMLAADSIDASIPAADVARAADVRQQLVEQAQQPGVGIAASTALLELDGWVGGHQSSYAAQIGLALGRQMTATLDEVTRYLEIIKRASGNEDLVAAQQTHQKKVSRRIRWISITAVLFLAAVGVVMGLGAISVTVGSILLAALLFGWMVTALVVFASGQRALFNLLHQMQRAAAEAEIAIANLRYATMDLRNVGDGYEQYLEWSAVLGTFLAEPFGPAPTGRAEPLLQDTTLPMSVRVGSVVVDDGAVAETAALLRRSIFSVGWLSAAWAGTVRSAGSRLGADGIDLRQRPEAIFSYAGGSDGLLHRWASSVVTSGCDPGSGNDFWATAVTEVLKGRSVEADRLMQLVRDPSAGVGTVPRARFLAGIDDSSSLRAGRFDSGLLTATGVTEGRGQVDWGIPVAAWDGVDHVYVLTQSSPALAEWHVVLGSTSDGQSSNDAETDVFPSRTVDF